MVSFAPEDYPYIQEKIYIYSESLTNLLDKYSLMLIGSITLLLFIAILVAV